MELVGCQSLREATRGCRAIVLTATETEAEPLREALIMEESHTLATKRLYVAAPVVLTCLLQAMLPPPELVLQVGIAGAFTEGGPGASAQVGDVVIATNETYADTGSSSPAGWLSAAELGLPIARSGDTELGGVFPLDLSLAEAARDVIAAAASVAERGAVEALQARPNVLLGPCVTSSCATGLRADGQLVACRWGALAESMEGAAAAHVSALYGVPFLEIRGISNLVTDRDRDSWEVERAVAAAAQAALAVVAAFGGD